MSLQVRLRHPLGERYIELPARGVDEPLVVGRSGACDVQVPSVAVGQRHCVLFVHEGRWVVQDAGSGGGTYVNGSKVDGAAFLSVGDVVSLGADANAPAVEVDPNGLAEGRIGPVLEYAAAPPVTPPAAGYTPPVSHPRARAGGYPAPYPAPAASYAPVPGYPHGAPHAAGGSYPAPPGYAPAPATYWPEPEAAAAPHPADPTADLADAVSAQNARYYTRRRQSSSNGGWVVAILITLAIGGGTGYWIYQHRQKTSGVAVRPAPAPPTQPATASRPPGDASRPPPTIFDKGIADPVAPKTPDTAPTTTPAANPKVAVPVAPADEMDPDMATSTGSGPDTRTNAVAPTRPATAGPAAGGAAQDPAAATGAAPAAHSNDASLAPDDPAWKQVQAARFSTDEAKAILQFEDFARANPDRFPEQIRNYTEKALDRLWFERVEQLYESRNELGRKIEETEKDLAEETDAAHKKRVLIPLKEQLGKRLEAVEEELSQNMKFDPARPPNLMDEAELGKLRRQRDPTAFNAWKTRVLAHIRRTHGELPWASDQRG